MNFLERAKKLVYLCTTDQTEDRITNRSASPAFGGDNLLVTFVSCLPMPEEKSMLQSMEQGECQGHLLMSVTLVSLEGSRSMGDHYIGQEGG